MTKSTPYFLPSEYQENEINITLDTQDSFYWDKSRVKRSSLHQFSVYKWAAEIIKKHNIQTVADIGCGYAAKLSWLHKGFPHLKILAVDQPHAVELCQKKYDFGEWIGLNFEDKPKALPHKVDLIISSDVIEHLEKPEYLLNYFKAVSTPETLILISTPERDLLRGEGCLHSPNAYHIREWNKKELSHFLEAQGFTIIEHKVLPAIRWNFQKFYISKVLRRALKGQTMRYNQAVLMKVSD